MTNFSQDGVSEAEFRTVIQEELKLIRSSSLAFPLFPRVRAPTDLPHLLTTANSDACARLGFDPKITFIVVTKDHKVIFFPKSISDGDHKGNCRPGTVIDSDVVDPIEEDYYLYGHAGLLGTSKPAHYTVLLDENGFTCVISYLLIQLLSNKDDECFTVYDIYRPDGIQSLSYALCHVYARCTRSVSLPAPIYCKFSFPSCQTPPPFIYVQINPDAHNVCTRAKNHYEPQHVNRLFHPDMVGTEGAPDQATGINENESEFERRFQQVHEHQAKRMYFL